VTDADRLIAVLRTAITTAEAHRRGLAELCDQLKKAGVGVMPAFAAWDAVNASEALVSSLRYRLGEAEEAQREDERIDASLRETGLDPDDFEDDEDEPSSAAALPEWAREPALLMDPSPLAMRMITSADVFSRLPSPSCYQTSFGPVHSRPSCRCPR
jgi:hypothetical protein